MLRKIISVSGISSIVLASGVGLQIACSKSSAAESIDLKPAEEPAPAAAIGISVGTLSHAGQACDLLAGAQEMTVTDTEIVVNYGARAEKKPADRLERGSCTWALPIQVPAGQKLIVDLAKNQAVHDISANGTSESSTEIFLAGSQGQFIDVAEKGRATGKKSRSAQETDMHLESACGAAVILRANNAVLLKDGSDMSMTQISGVTLNYHLEACP